MLSLFFFALRSASVCRKHVSKCALDSSNWKGLYSTIILHWHEWVSYILQLSSCSGFCKRQLGGFWPCLGSFTILSWGIINMTVANAKSGSGMLQETKSWLAFCSAVYCIWHLISIWMVLRPLFRELCRSAFGCPTKITFVLFMDANECKKKKRCIFNARFSFKIFQLLLYAFHLNSDYCVYFHFQSKNKFV